MSERIVLPGHFGDYDVECELCDVAPHLPYSFVVHETCGIPGSFDVSERSTGLAVPRRVEASSKEMAIENARIRLAPVTPERFEKVMEQARKMLAEHAA